MLRRLYIRNYALIEELGIDFSAHLNVITGETGAGKSILRGALGLLTGERADTKVLLKEGENCIVEGLFELSQYNLKSIFDAEDLEYEPLCLIRRQISPSGRSRAFVNDTPVRLESLKKIGVRLMDIHAQHDTLRLTSNEYQLEVLDAYANVEAELKTYQSCFKTYQQALQAFQKLQKDANELRKAHDYNRFLWEELDRANLDALDQADMEQTLERLENVELIKQSLQSSNKALTDDEFSVDMILQEAANALGKARNFSEEYNALYERLQSAIIEIRDIASEIESEFENIDTDEEAAEKIRHSLNLLYDLERKHHVETLEELIAIRNDLEEKVGQVENFDEALAQRQKALADAETHLKKAAQDLRQKRQQAIPDTETEIGELLKELGMPQARFQIQMREIEFAPLGADEIEFYFSANQGVRMQPMREVASGGEFSRLMLCIKYRLAKHIALPTIVFDEIDTGVSGEIALKMGKMIHDMSSSHQVLTISHLPQIAAKGEAHYYVYKDLSNERTISKIRRLSDDERVQEIAQMIGGDKPGTHIYESAKELLKGI
ncbi:MAG: DNA repair protein RecN [Bernardetiaceae bacterium]|nr:DNA repair protein RecN [Bernardetiaceae bacterium]